MNNGFAFRKTKALKSAYRLCYPLNESYLGVMTQLMERAIQELTKVPEEEQDHIAALVLDEVLHVEQKWDALLASNKSHDLLAQLADEAIAEFERGETLPLDDFLTSE